MLISAAFVTLIATSTNIVVSGILVQQGMPPVGLFELTPVGLPIALVGLAYMLSLGRRLMPDRQGAVTLTEEFHLRPYITEIRLLPGSTLAGKTLAESSFAQVMGVTVLAVLRGDTRLVAPRGEMELVGDDTLLRHLARVLKAPGFHVRVAFGAPLDPSHFDRRGLARGAARGERGHGDEEDGYSDRAAWPHGLLRRFPGGGGRSARPRASRR